MTQLVWAQQDYETGLDRGVLYVDGLPGVPWNGLTGVTEAPSGGEAKPLYIDGMKYLNLASREEFEGTINAYFSPPEFDMCDGAVTLVDGLNSWQNVRKPFGFSFRTNTATSYKIHIIYNALAQPSSRTYKSISESIDPLSLSWKITTRSIPFPGLQPTAHVVIDSALVDPAALEAIETALYGSVSSDAYLPLPTELLGLFVPITVTDNGDGTFTITGPDDVVVDNLDGTFTITHDIVIDNGDGTFTISTP